ncbi:MAG TPA: S-methyl-5-thioribose-1-phosphate isomerase [Gaiellales bacterium]
MPVATEILSPHAILRLEEDAVVMLDQRRLPDAVVELRLTTWQDVAEAIREMAVRGAPAIGVAAAYGVALAAARSTAGSVEVLREDVTRAGVGLAAARPTAVNLPWAVAQMAEEAARPHRDAAALREALRARAEAIHADEVERCVRIGEHGAGLLRAGAQVLTHCNAGALATGGFGTALGVVRAAHRRDPGLHVWIDETRPLFQGARLTAWELQQEDIPATLITDSTAAWLMAERKVDAIVTGADRIARNGDTANKIGTYGLAVLARAHGLPFYVAAPTSTIDPTIESGRDIPIEHRRPEEVAAGAARGVGVYNPAFDVTPAEYVSAIVTERGVHRPPYVFS